MTKGIKVPSTLRLVLKDSGGSNEKNIKNGSTLTLTHKQGLLGGSVEPLLDKSDNTAKVSDGSPNRMLYASRKSLANLFNTTLASAKK